MFQMPVRTRTAKAGHATWLKRRAAAPGASGPTARSVGTSAARVSWPPTHTVAATMCTNRRTASQENASIGWVPSVSCAGPGEAVWGRQRSGLEAEHVGLLDVGDLTGSGGERL